MITDEVKIEVTAGKGGDGAVAFNKIKMNLGPTGGRGGNGGNVYFEGVSDLTALNKYRHKKDYYAPDGQNGKNDNSDGRTGKDLVLTVPVGSIIFDLDSGKSFDITEKGKKLLLAKGGQGGRGNFMFRSSINTSPEERELGANGESVKLKIELRFIADIGLIGLPSAGKSSLLNELTSAKAKVGNYDFTTLEPNLGSMEGIILADIPGLIEGASSGKGLGIRFLRHIQRTKILLHCISAETGDFSERYQVIRRELAAYDSALTKKREIVLLTKTDLVENAEEKKIIAELKKINPHVFSISIHDLDKINSLKQHLRQELERII